MTALIIAVVGSASPNASQRALASTIGNADYYNDSYNDGAPSHITSVLWGGIDELVTQRYGCTAFAEDLAAGNAHNCPYPYVYWHHGIDISASAHQTWYAGGSGTVVDTQYAALGIQDPNGRIVYYVHGDTYQVSKPAQVSGGQALAQASSPCIAPPGGNCTGTHLHLEVHNSVIGTLDTDDINPESWLRGWGPTVSALLVTGSPTAGGPAAGGSSVVITGTGFQGVIGPAGVMFGASAAASYTVDSDTQITAVSPAYDPGTVDITITNNGITSAITNADQYTYTQCSSVSATANPSSGTTIGNAVFISATALGCPNPLYRFWIKLPTSNWYIVQDYSPSNTYNWYTTGQVAGSYAIGVWVHDAKSPGACGSMGCSDALTSIPYTLTASVCDPRVCPQPAPCTSVSLSAAPPSPASAGTPVTVTGSAVTCPNPLYEFWMRASGSNTWLLLQAYSTIPTYDWNSTGAAPGTEYFGVWAKDASSSTSTFDANASIPYAVTVTLCAPNVTESALPASPSMSGTPVTFTGGASGCPNPLYEFWMRPASSDTWQLVRGYTVSNAFHWGTSRLPGGTNYFGVWARDASSVAVYDANASMSYTLIAASCTSVTASAVPTSVAHSTSNGPHVTITGSGACPHPNPQYEFWARWQGTTNWVLLQGYSTSPTYDWNSTGAAPGTEYFGVWVKDVNSATSTFDANANTPVTVT